MEVTLDQFELLLGEALTSGSPRAQGIPTAGGIRRLASVLWPAVVARRACSSASTVEPDKRSEKHFEAAAPLLAELVADPAIDSRLVKQLLQTLALPPFTQCRDSYLTGANRRLLEKCRERVSGSHCVDCPHTLAFSSTEEHQVWLAQQWGGAPAACDPAWEVFLPSAWRRLRAALA